MCHSDNGYRTFLFSYYLEIDIVEDILYLSLAVITFRGKRALYRLTLMIVSPLVILIWCIYIDIYAIYCTIFCLLKSIWDSFSE